MTVQLLKDLFMGKISALFVVLVLALSICAGTTLLVKKKNDNKRSAMKTKPQTNPDSALGEVEITVIYDNHPYKKGLETGWGFSCLVRGAEKTILFDLGGSAPLFFANMDKLGIKPGEIDSVVLSHYHGDHTGPTHELLIKNPDVTLYALQSFPESFKKDAAALGADVIDVKDPTPICKNVLSTGELGTWIKEQSMIIHTKRGLIVITGCAHPGITHIVSTAKSLGNTNVLLVMGGFHLGSKSGDQIKKIISDFRELGVKYAGPCHCTGTLARKLFQEDYKQNFVDIGTGKVITMEDLK
jgi:7,8-dihydropterin-6-yl-methyl-4-(beta-D-ribofuranosyl)aminobenzene 5'-phosphate synthase